MNRKPLHARIIKFFDGKVFFCFFLFSALHSTPLLGINQQKKKNVPAKFCRHQIPIYIPTKSNNSENSSLNFVPNLFFFIIFWCDFFLFLLCFGVIISFHVIFWCDYFRDVESGVLICFSSYRGIRVGNLLNPPAALNPITTCLHTTRNSFLTIQVILQKKEPRYLIGMWGN